MSVAVAVVALALAALGALWHAHQRQAALHEAPITLSAAAEGTVWVHLQQSLHGFDAHGTPIGRVADVDLGLAAPVLHLHALTRDHLLVAAGTPPRVLRCTVSARRCSPVDHGYVAAFGRFKNKVWIGANADGSRVVVSDNAAHRVAVLDGEGSLLASGGPDQFKYPSQPVWVGGDGFRIANSEKRRIEHWRVEPGSASFVQASQPVVLRATDPILVGRAWPMALARDGQDGLWVVVKKSWLDPGGVVHLSPAGLFDRDLTLPVDLDATAVTPLGDALIVADFEGPRLHRLGLKAGATADPFGGEAFAQELRAHAAQVSKAESLQTMATGAMIGLPLLGALILFAMGERAPPRATRYEPPEASPLRHAMPSHALPAAPVRIGITQQQRRTLRQGLLVTVLVTAALAALYAYMGFTLGHEASALMSLLRGLYALMLVVVAAGGVVAARRLRDDAARSLVIDRDRVRVEVGDKVTQAAPLDQCWTDGRSVLIEGRMVMLIDPRGRAVFEPEAVKAHLLPRIPLECWISTWRLNMLAAKAWRRRHPVQLVLFGLLFALVIVAMVAERVVPRETRNAWIASWLVPLLQPKDPSSR